MTVQASVDFCRKHPFTQIGKITTTEAALAVDERDEDSVDALTATGTVIYEVPYGAPVLEFRFRADGSENNSTTLHMYAKPKTEGSAEDPEHYIRVCDITALQGTQDCGVGHFCDELTLANEVWNFRAADLVVQTVTDEIGRLYWRTNAFEKVLFIASAKTPTTIYIDAKVEDLHT